MVSIKEKYVSTMQNFMNVADIKASAWSFRTIMDLGSVGKNSNVLTPKDRVAIAARGSLAILFWLPINIVAIPHIFILGAVHSRFSRPTPMPQLHEIISGLYLGTVQAAQSKETLEKHGITTVVSILDSEIMVPENVHVYKRVSVEDSPHVDLAPAIQEVYDTILPGLNEGKKVLIHCEMGQSRSASVTAAIVMKLENCSSKEALAKVKQRRNIIALNYGFNKQILRMK